MVACSNSEDDSIDEDLWDVVWNLDSIQTPDTIIVAPQYGLAVIHFTRDMGMRGRTVHVKYSGIYEITGTSLLIEVVEPSELQCSHPSINCIFIEALGNVAAYDVNENRLDLYKDGRYMLNFHPSRIDEEILDKLWKVDSLQTPEAKIIPIQDSLIMVIQSGDTTFVPNWEEDIMTAIFDIDMAMGGKLVCNIYGGAYEISEKGKIALGPVLQSEIACTYAAWIESLFTDAMRTITNYTVTGSSLILYDGSHNAVFNLSVQ